MFEAEGKQVANAATILLMVEQVINAADAKSQLFALPRASSVRTNPDRPPNPSSSRPMVPRQQKLQDAPTKSSWIN